MAGPATIPDVKITKLASGVASAPREKRERPEQLTVTIRGVDVFDSTTGAVRTGDTDDIACWFIDTDYDGQSFFVRHAYFLYGGKNTSDGPYDKLKKALAGRDRRGRMVKALPRDQPAVRPAQVGQDRGKGHQPLRRRGAEGVSGVGGCQGEVAPALRSWRCHRCISWAVPRIGWGCGAMKQ